MRFQVWLYKNINNSVTVCLRDTALQLHTPGSVMIRDQSSYEEDGGKLVWKRAAYPASVFNAMQESKGILIAESDVHQMLDANISWKTLNYLWEIKA